jgi:hypothetical protein
MRPQHMFTERRPLRSTVSCAASSGRRPGSVPKKATSAAANMSPSGPATTPQPPLSRAVAEEEAVPAEVAAVAAAEGEEDSAQAAQLLVAQKIRSALLVVGRTQFLALSRRSQALRLFPLQRSHVPLAYPSAFPSFATCLHAARPAPWPRSWLRRGRQPWLQTEP